MGTILIETALSEILKNLTQPVITDYQIGVLIFNLYSSGQHKGKKLNLRLEVPNRAAFLSIFKNLIDKVLYEFKPLSSTYEIFGKKITLEEEVICSVDPFAYISHLSAMEYYGITDRIPRLIYYSSPESKKWRSFAREKMSKDFNNKENDLPRLSLINIKKFEKKNISKHPSVHHGAFKNVSGSILRVSSVGRTFLDMLRRPDLCGGIYHVIDVYKEFVGQYLNLIVDEINQHGNKIEKVRAGYILEELCEIKHDVYKEWVKCAQRGGSRKLDPNNEYASEYSEKWCISINAEL